MTLMPSTSPSKDHVASFIVQCMARLGVRSLRRWAANWQFAQNQSSQQSPRQSAGLGLTPRLATAINIEWAPWKRLLHSSPTLRERADESQNKSQNTQSLLRGSSSPSGAARAPKSYSSRTPSLGSQWGMLARCGRSRGCISVCCLK